MGCAIRDLTEKGARIKLQSIHQALPSNVLLIDVRGGAAYEADVAWSRPPEFGLHFISRHDMNALPAEFAYLRRIWVDASVR